ncbi:MAG TPA: hypothetical protein VFI23_01705 [Rhizomicrobium sp.]|nr:hypothetical protein [Rhizomicrobium sp.]
MAIDNQMSNAWAQAAADLGIRVIAPFSLIAGDEELNFEAFVPDFGSAEGAVVMSEISERKLDRWFSILYPSYRQYDRAHFIETLDDWGWFGAGKPPDWFTGGSYTS